MDVRRSLTAFAAVIGVFVFGHSTAFAQLVAVLAGGNEVSPTGAAGVGDPDGSGTATLLLHADGTLCYAILVTAIDTPTLADIDQGVAGVNGPVVVPLTPPETGEGLTADCIPVDPTVLTSIQQNPAGFYVNVSTDAFPNGAIRGQLFGGAPALHAPALHRSRSR